MALRIVVWFVTLVVLSVAVSIYLQVQQLGGSSPYSDGNGIDSDAPNGFAPPVLKRQSNDREAQAVGEALVHDRNNVHSFRKTDFGNPSIMVLVGPHKTASSSLQDFLVNLLGSTVSLESHTNETIIDKNINNSTTITSSSSNTTRRIPHASIAEWVWPVEVRSEYEVWMTNRSHAIPNQSRKFFAILASSITGRKANAFFKLRGPHSRAELQTTTAAYFTALLEAPVRHGKKIVLASEEFDAMAVGLAASDADTNHSTTALGEARHVAPESSQMIDRLLRILPTTTAAVSSSASFATTKDSLEIHIHHRIPRIDHLRSIWNQRAQGHTFREFLQNPSKRMEMLYQVNSLGLALQFVRHGIRTTVVDMQGVSEKDEALLQTETETDRNGNITVIGGLQGVLCCDVLRLGQSSSSSTHRNNSNTHSLFCDDHSRLHLPNYDQPIKHENHKQERYTRDLTNGQLQAMDSLLKNYDCILWNYLQKYQEEGLFRILYPSKNLFNDCNAHAYANDTNTNDPRVHELSFFETLQKISEIASRDNGIPIRTKSMEDAGVVGRRKRPKQAEKQIQPRNT